MTFPCIKCKIHKYTITQIRKYTNTKCLKDPTCAIFFKSMGFKDIKYDIPVCQIHYIYRTFTGHLQDIYRTFTGHSHYIYILTERPVVLSNAIFSSVRSSSGYHGLLHIRKQATFSNFSNSSDSKVKVKVKGPNMCYIFEKHGIQGYRI